MAAEGLTARKAALGLLDAVLGDGQMLGQTLADPAGPLATATPSDRARAQRLAANVLRQIEPADRILAPHLRKHPPLLVRNILRLAVVELASGAAPHGVVNAAVDLTRHGNRTGHLTGLVNAVLRALTTESPLTDTDTAPSNTLLAGPVQKLPRWLRQPMVHTYGRDAVARMESVFSAPPPLDLTLKPGATHPEGTLLSTGSLRLADPGQISNLPGYATGDWWVQDAAAALAVPLLNPQPGESILDLCAAPGGKTLQLAASGADVTAVDISGPRMARLADNLTRCKLTATLITDDALNWQTDARFDAILLDAPCSATGTIRRHPDLPFVKDDSDLPDLMALQSRLIDRALSLLKPGGRLVICTCSLLPQEGEQQLTALLTRHPSATVEHPALFGIDPAWITPEGALRLRPDYWADLGGMDGFFMACLTRG